MRTIYSCRLNKGFSLNRDYLDRQTREEGRERNDRNGEKTAKMKTFNPNVNNMNNYNISLKTFRQKQ